MSSDNPASKVETLDSILNFVSLDIETTGLDTRKDEIIQIAAIRFVYGRKEAVFDTFVKPNRRVPTFIKALTHISEEDLKRAPSIEMVLPQLLSFVGESVIVGQNIAFDLDFIDENLIRTGKFPLKNQRWDTAEIGRVYLPFVNNHKLGTMCREFGIVLEHAHRADADAIATGELLCRLTHHIYDHYNLVMNARLLDLAKQAKLEGSLYHYLHRLVEFQRHYALIGKKPEPPENKLVNVIEHQIPGKGVADLENVFGPSGIFSQRFENYEFRSGQLEMAKHIALAFEQEHHLAVEAGTGVGKSFAYLVPAMQFGHDKKCKVLISTNTKNLQEQLFFKDIPALRRIIPIPFKACLVKGRDNYICERRWNEMLSEQSKGYTDYEAHAMLYLMVWKQLTHTGDISENSSFDRSRFSFVWRKICSDRYLCGGRKCPMFKACYLMKLRKDIEDSSLVVANHSLLLADMQSENTSLGEYSYLVVDEAHNLMSSAARLLGFELGYADLNSLLQQLGSSHRRQHSGFLSQLNNAVQRCLATAAVKAQMEALVRNAEKKIEALRKPLQELFNEAGKIVLQADSFGKCRVKSSGQYQSLDEDIKTLQRGWKEIAKDIAAISNVLSTIKSEVLAQYDSYVESLGSFGTRLMEIEQELMTLLDPDLESNALWLENSGGDRNTPSSLICYAPIEVGEQLNRILYKNVRSIIFTSATLALRGSFKFFKGQSGLNLVEDGRLVEEIVDSPFDYDKQSRLMISSFLPEPKDKFFGNQALACLEQIVTTVDVGTMVLFTSYKDLNQVFDHLSDVLYQNNRSFFAQGKGSSRSSILSEFKQMDNAVLLGTSSFWEGVDIQGKSLSLLILYKLPFLVPSEPVVEAYIDKLEQEQKDSFMHYMLPNALLKLRQGFGRLIRSKSDTGIVLIMDSRVSSKKYGSYFKEVLPCQSREFKSEQQLFSEIAAFFKN
ncbi:MAG: helicase C-terminal domain-containing protein [Candidatus Cloacimonadota bacterium]